MYKFIRDKKTEQLLGSFLWNVIGSVTSKGSVFIVSIMAARYLGVEDFAKLSLVQQTVAVFTVFSVLGLSVTSIKLVACAKKDGRLATDKIIKKIIYFTTCLSLIVAVVYIGAAEHISSVFFQRSDLSNLIKLSSFILIVTAINQVQFSILSGLGNFRYCAIVNISTSIFNVVYSFLLMRAFGVEGVIMALSINGVLISLLNVFFIKKERNKIVENNTDFKSDIGLIDIVGFATPNLLGAIVCSLSSWYILTLLTKKSDITEVAVLSASNQIFAIIYMMPIMLAQVMMSMTASTKKEDLNILKKTIIITLIFTVPLAMVGVFFSNSIFMLYGYEFGVYDDVLEISCLTVIIVAVSTQFEHYIVAKGRVWQHFKLNVIYSALYVVISMVNLDKGAIGVVYAQLISYSLRLILIFLIIWVDNVKNKKTVFC